MLPNILLIEDMNIPGFSNAPRHGVEWIPDTMLDATLANPLDVSVPENAEMPQNRAYEVGAVPQLNLVDFPNTLAPYVPTWTHPFEAFPEPTMGWLGELPPELFRVFISSIPLADVATLAQVSRSMSAVLTTGCSPYASLLPLVERAWTDQIDMADVVLTLAVVEAMPVRLRAGALLAVASTQVVCPKASSGEDLTADAWAEVITRTRDAVYKEIEPQAQLPMLVDLDVVAWNVLFFKPMANSARDPLLKDACNRMLRMPSACWPIVLDAAVSRARALAWLDMQAVVADDAICFPAISDSVAVVLAAHPALLAEEVLMLDVMRKRFGLTEDQYVRLVRPMEAMRLFCIRENTTLAFSDFWNSYPIADPILREMVEAISLEKRIASFWITGLPPRTTIAFATRCGSGDNEAINEVARWRAKSASFFLKMEFAACVAPDSGLPSEASAQLLMDAISTLIRKMKSRHNVQTCLSRIFEQPLRFQPVLLARWAEAIHWNRENAAYVPLLAPISEWCADTVKVMVSNKEYVNATRACVAELSAYVKIYNLDWEKIEPILDTVTRKVFDTMPSEAWGTMLAYLDRMSMKMGGHSWISKDTLHRLNGTFLKNPRAVLRDASGIFFQTLCKKAGRIFDELPDLVDGNTSTVDRLLDRLGVSLPSRELALRMIVFNVGMRTPDGTPHLHAVVRAELKRAGFTDRQSLAYALIGRRR
jgi:hypothetical protein